MAVGLSEAAGGGLFSFFFFLGGGFSPDAPLATSECDPDPWPPVGLGSAITGGWACR